MNAEPKVIEVFADNGEHSHYTLIDSETGDKLWSEYPEECKAKGYPVEQLQPNVQELVERWEQEILHHESIINNPKLSEDTIFEPKIIVKVLKLIISDLKALQVQGEWISVEDRLPEFNKEVLISRIGDKTQKPPPTLKTIIAKRVSSNKDGEIWHTDNSVVIGEVTHWQPLPEPPIKE